MNNKNIILLVGILVLLGGAFVYWNNKDLKINEPKSAREITTEKVSNETEAEMGAEIETSETSEIANTQEIENSTIYYYGAECPHCKDVLAYFDENDIYNKVQFIKKEVWHNKANGEELRNAALKCGMNPANIGVPFVFSKGKCYIGGPDVIAFFAKEAGIEK